MLQGCFLEQLAETIINSAKHLIIPEYITTVPDVAQLIEYKIDGLLCPYLTANRGSALIHHHPIEDQQKS